MTSILHTRPRVSLLGVAMTFAFPACWVIAGIDDRPVDSADERPDAEPDADAGVAPETDGSTDAGREAGPICPTAAPPQTTGPVCAESPTNPCLANQQCCFNSGTCTAKGACPTPAWSCDSDRHCSPTGGDGGAPLLCCMKFAERPASRDCAPAIREYDMVAPSTCEDVSNVGCGAIGALRICQQNDSCGGPQFECLPVRIYRGGKPLQLGACFLK